METLMPSKSIFFAQADMLSMKPTFERKKNEFGKESLFVSNVAIFRSGTFKDSFGEQHTFDAFGIETFIRNFNYLKDSNVFSKPVVRAGHPHPFNNGRLESVIGYINDLSTENRQAPHDGHMYDYLIAELEIIDETAKQNIESGLWLNRSAELGNYEDNAGQNVAPVILGVAYVDIPAVEGLNFTKNTDPNSSIDGFLISEEYTKMANNTLPNAATLSGIQMPTAPFTFSIGGNDTADTARVQGYITELESKFASSEAKVAQFEADKKKLEDENKVLKEFQSTVRAKVREDFIDGLAKSQKILESAKESTKAFAATLTDEQFESWKTTMGNAPAAPVLGDYGNQDGGNHDSERQENKQDNFEVEKGIVSNLKSAGVSVDKIKASAAYQRIIAADPKFTI